jgi:hypothetical protein
MRKQLIASMSRGREQAERFCAEAEAAGKRKEAISWRAQIRKLDKLAAKYGWTLNA